MTEPRRVVEGVVTLVVDHPDGTSTVCVRVLTQWPRWKAKDEVVVADDPVHLASTAEPIALRLAELLGLSPEEFRVVYDARPQRLRPG